jgi:hypothetical protein
MPQLMAVFRLLRPLPQHRRKTSFIFRMDNLCAGIRASSYQQTKGAGYRGLSASIAPDFHPHQGVAGFTGIGGSFRMEWVAALPWNQWQDWSGIRMQEDLEMMGKR